MSRRSSESSVRFDRREFLFLASGTAGVILSSPSVAADIGAELPTHRFRVRRDADLLSLDFRFVNFARHDDELLALGAGRSLVIVSFPPQNLAEARFDKVLEKAPRKSPDDPLPFAERDSRSHSITGGTLVFEEVPLPKPPPFNPNETGDEQPPKNVYDPEPPVAAYLSGPSWIVFAVADNTRIPLSLAAAHRSGRRYGGVRVGPGSIVDIWLQMMGDWPIRVPAQAVVPDRRPVMPAYDETCLEIPFRVFISPLSKSAKWLTSSMPRMPFEGPQRGAVELWHAALHQRTKINAATLPPDFANVPPELQPPKSVTLQARAVFSPDYRSRGEPEWREFYPGLLPLSHRAQTRHLLVKQMSENDGWIDAEHLILTALGADASLSYNTQRTFRELHDKQLADPKSPESQAPLAIWKHRMVVGRDVFMVDVRMGWLMPLVFPALFVELTRRSFAARVQEEKPYKFGPPGAYLLTERFILVQDPVKQFGDSKEPLGRKMPFKKATLLETRSPLLQTPSNIRIPFIPRMLADGGEVRWPIEFEDENGRPAKTTDACLTFAANVVEGHADWATQPERILNWKLPGEKFALAPDKAELKYGTETKTSYFFQDPERAGLAALSRELRKRLPEATEKPVDQLKKLADLQNQIASWPQQAQDAIANLQDASRAEIAKAAAAFNGSVDQAQGYLDDLLRQFGRAEQVSSEVELHSIKLVSRRVDKLFRAVNDGGKNRLQEALDAAGSRNDFIAAVRRELLKDFPNDIDNPELKKFLGEINARLCGMDQQPWTKQQQELRPFLDEIVQAANAAEGFFRHGFQAQMDSAQIIVPALKAMGGAGGPQQFELLDQFVAKGISKVENGVFGKFNGAIDEGRAMADRIKCAVAQPATQIAGLSRDLGALTGSKPEDIAKLAQQTTDLDISSAIPDFKLLGVLPMRLIVSTALGSAEVPTINLVNFPDHVEQIWEWNTRIKDEKNLGIVKFIPAPKPQQGSAIGDPVHLYIRMTTRIDLPKVSAGGAASPPSGRIQLEGKLAYWNVVKKKPLEGDDLPDSFSVRLLGLIDIAFRDLTFESNYPVGGNPDPKLKPRLGTITFLPPLDFVKKLQEMIPVLGEGFRIVQSAGRIGVSYEFELPAIAFGVFSLRNLAIGSAAMFSLEGKPLRFDFNFSSWKEPFELTVMCFGGRGFFALAADTGGYREVQGMLEFGGSLAFDVGVASGGLYVMGGIYFRMTQDSTQVAGFIRAGGCLDVLGLIHASVEFLLMLSYEKTASGSSLKGIARVTVSIDLFLTSIDVTIEMQKTLAGSDDDGSSGTSRLDRRPLYLVSHSTLVSEKTPVVYFTRTKANGRFDDAQLWNNDYWSQFAY